MKIYVNGWARDLGSTTMLNKQLSPKARAEEMYVLPKGTLRFTVEEARGPSLRGSVRIASEVERPLALNGNYEVNVNLSAKEVMMLASELTKKMSLGEVIDQLVKLRGENG